MRMLLYTSAEVRQSDPNLEFCLHRWIDGVLSLSSAKCHQNNVCFTGEFAEDGVKKVIDMCQGGGGDKGGEAAGGAEEKDKGGFSVGDLMPGGGDKTEEDGGGE